MHSLQIIRSLLLSAALFMSCSAADARDTWNFRVFLDEREIGIHRFQLIESEDRRTLSSTARFAVRLLMIPAYRYEHVATERWDGDCLEQLISRTDDDGEAFEVQAERLRDATIVRTPRGTQRLDACVMSFAYWNPRMLRETRLLNPQDGEYVNVRIDTAGTETIIVSGTPTQARRYALRSADLSIDLWYSLDDRWLALETIAPGGRKLSYRLQ
jgi:hypothetical protein